MYTQVLIHPVRTYYIIRHISRGRGRVGSEHGSIAGDSCYPVPASIGVPCAYNVYTEGTTQNKGRLNFGKNTVCTVF